MSKLHLIDSQTAINLAKAFAGESQARNRYTFFGEAAGEAGFTSIQDVFLKTADEERGHGEMFFEYLAEGLGDKTLTPEVLVPIFLGDTAGNLAHASKTEHLEWTDLYPSFARIAYEEGFDEVALSFSSIASIERRHDMRFRDLLNRLETDTLYTQCRNVTWQCANCGFRHKGLSAPDPCPACHHAQQFFSIVDPCIL